ncbi:MAG: hypothetical protein COS82_10930 [Zetaproteobacteria bacterium CG06_land_8_20_14_3_00_59_53]|nr:MAG: hypothetical protein AUK36_09280 [Zetaproteobacteria bacterium CG2_30_59_37]PIO90023.1 MAG: hypothetical protein COX56_04130 [Zetaproteobacteria bacterium CG23_combo_of_CG06-09_8_20_14_all_59_86]PIQ65005.1 MAG: hypothetical protein COV97_06345 [Zetaproteobacteria bacterium CG11_big_fil_rev_8_21_14_0_20_59_439]PIU69425.1 MAG: hypothetical protein COS82_10930 [Zetaproteobacteria bacterium CG06_land_8_20_14_3_00_59_53]PIU96824.1 MAG: hypothetical protein COS62_07470 [Zetaproteobacteria bac
MEEAICFKKTAATITDVGIIAFAIGANIYIASVLPDPKMEALAGSGYWNLVVIALFTVLFVRLFRMRELVTNTDFAKKSSCITAQRIPPYRLQTVGQHPAEQQSPVGLPRYP